MRLKRRRTPPRARELTIDELLDLLCGPGRDPDGNLGSAAETETERREAWEAHKKPLLEHAEGKPWMTPWAAERYESAA